MEILTGDKFLREWPFFCIAQFKSQIHSFKNIHWDSQRWWSEGREWNVSRKASGISARTTEALETQWIQKLPGLASKPTINNDDEI